MFQGKVFIEVMRTQLVILILLNKIKVMYLLLLLTYLNV